MLIGALRQLGQPGNAGVPLSSRWPCCNQVPYSSNQRRIVRLVLDLAFLVERIVDAYTASYDELIPAGQCPQVVAQLRALLRSLACDT